MKSRKTDKIEFIAKTITDLGKAILVVGFASSFFEKFPMTLRIMVALLSIGFIFGGIFLYPSQGGRK